MFHELAPCAVRSRQEVFPAGYDQQQPPTPHHPKHLDLLALKLRKPDIGQVGWLPLSPASPCLPLPGSFSKRRANPPSSEAWSQAIAWLIENRLVCIGVHTYESLQAVASLRGGVLVEGVGREHVFCATLSHSAKHPAALRRARDVLSTAVKHVCKMSCCALQAGPRTSCLPVSVHQHHTRSAKRLINTNGRRTSWRQRKKRPTMALKF